MKVLKMNLQRRDKEKHRDKDGHSGFGKNVMQVRRKWGEETEEEELRKDRQTSLFV